MGFLERPEVFGRRFGNLAQIDSASDADVILAKRGEGNNLVRFRLIYQGNLKSAGASSRLKDKWDIRNALSPQLEELWLKHPGLQEGIGVVEDDHYSKDGYLKKLSAEQTSEIPKKFRERIRTPVLISGSPFLSVVQDQWDATCSLDILFLRKDVGSSVISNGGDLDNRLKVLFDGLRAPTEDEVPNGHDSSKTTYCLAEDDALISDFSVKTDRLLTHPGAAPSEVTLVIEVVVKIRRVTEHNAFFLGLS